MSTGRTQSGTDPSVDSLLHGLSPDINKDKTFKHMTDDSVPKMRMGNSELLWDNFPKQYMLWPLIRTVSVRQF